MPWWLRILAIFASLCTNMLRRTQDPTDRPLWIPTGAVAQHLQSHVEGFTTSELRRLETPTTRRFGGFHDVQHHDMMTVDLPPWRKSLAWRGRFSKVRSQSASEYSIINQRPTHFVDWGSQRQAYSDNSIRHVLGRRLDFSHFQILLR